MNEVSKQKEEEEKAHYSHLIGTTAQTVLLNIYLFVFSHLNKQLRVQLPYGVNVRTTS